MSGPVLIVSTLVDLATDAVVEELNELGTPLVRVNTEDFPFSAEIDYSIGTSDSKPIFCVPSGRQTWYSSVWYRRLRIPSIPKEMDSGVYDFCIRETRSALVGGLLGHQTRWMSRPAAIWEAEFKPYQLHVATNLGLSIPKTLISNKAESIRSFCANLKGVIAKPVRSGHVVKEGVECAVFTTKLRDEDLDDLTNVHLSPTIYQELIPKKYDIRVTIVGSRVFVAAIDSQSDPNACIDWRKTENPELPHFPIELPPSLIKMLLELMSRLSLTYGAIDLILTPDGRYLFLEVNPNGQWLWLDDMLSLGISRAVAKWLSEDMQ
jgi:glutathione synthase/RimK-type ligase-like ATP-grasp enzyme